MKTRVLLVDDEADVRSMLRIVLEANDFDVADVPNVGAVLAAVRDHRPHVVVLDHDLGSAVTGVELAPLIKHQDPSCQVLLFSAGLPDDGVYASVDFSMNKLSSISSLVARISSLAGVGADAGGTAT